MERVLKILLINFFLFLNSFSHNFSLGDNHNIYETLEQIQKDIQTLEKAVYSNSINSENNNTNFSSEISENSSEDVLIDGGEIHEFKWIKPQEAMDLHHLGELTLMPPTYLSMSLISHYITAEVACRSLAERTPYSVTPRLCQLDGQMMCLYPGDAGYLSNDPAIDGPRHRTSFTSKGMIYAHSGKNVGVAPMDQP